MSMIVQKNHWMSNSVFKCSYNTPGWENIDLQLGPVLKSHAPTTTQSLIQGLHSTTCQFS